MKTRGRRPHIVFAWEIGFGYGHLTGIAALADIFLRKSCRVSAILPSLERLRKDMLPEGLELHEAPNFHAPRQDLPLSINYSANLSRNGFWSVETVTNRLNAWRRILRQIDPDVLIVDHAPSALLASRDQAYRCIAIGNGFSLPPLTDPMPSLQPWFSDAEPLRRSVDDTLLAILNPILDELRLPMLERIADLFDGVLRFICIESEFDHYEARSDEHYFGAIAPLQSGKATYPPVDFPDEFIFLYLSADNPFLAPLLTRLRGVGLQVLACIPGDADCGNDDVITRLPGLVDLNNLIGRARFGITEGNTLTTAFLVKHGVSTLVCPRDLEKAVMGYRLQQRGLARSCNWFAPADQVSDHIDALISESHQHIELRKCKARYDGLDSSHNSETIAATIERAFS